MRVQRTEISRLDDIERLATGAIRVPATPTRVGVLEYSDGAGKTWREYRPADEVFAPESLATLRSSTLTDLHPDPASHPEGVTAQNWGDLAVGHVADDVRPAGEFVAVSVLVQDAAEVAMVDAGTRRELSCGYTCDVDPTPGTTSTGETYDAVQRNIRYNHVALGPSGWGRAGSECALRLDGGNAVHHRPLPMQATPPATQVQTDAAAKAVRASSPVQTQRADASTESSMKVLKIGKREIKLDASEDQPAAQGAVDEMVKKSDTDAAMIETLEKALQDFAGQLAMWKAQATAAAATAAPTPAAGDEIPDAVMDAAIAVREGIRAVATAYGVEAKGMKHAEAIKAVVAKAFPSVKLDAADPKTIATLFDAARDAKPAAKTDSKEARNDELAAANRVAAGIGGENRADAADDDDDPAEALRRRSENRWRGAEAAAGKVA